jgi:hypothetical protein
MKYMLLIYNNREALDALPADELQAVFDDVNRLMAELTASGEWVGGAGLAVPSSAKTVRVRDGVVATTDGPFAESKEHVAGFWVLKCEDLDAALSWAEQASVACACPVEVRPFDDLSQA